jgi:hypothetical protein
MRFSECVRYWLHKLASFWILDLVALDLFDDTKKSATELSGLVCRMPEERLLTVGRNYRESLIVRYQQSQ